VFLLYIAVSFFYINMIFDGLESVTRSSSDGFVYGLIIPCLLAALVTSVAWFEWNRGRKTSALDMPALRYFFIGGSTRRIFWSNFLILNLFTWVCVVLSNDNGILPFIAAVLVMGILISLMAWKLDAADLSWQGLLLTGACGIALSFPDAWEFSLFGGSYSSGVYLNAVVSSLALGAYLIFRIFRRMRGGGFSAFLFCALLARWYFNAFYSFRSKSLFFILGGALLIMAAFAYWKWNKTAQAKMGQSGAGAPGESE
jgi:hypothetical protein